MRDPPEGAGSERGDRVEFDCRARLEFRGAHFSSDGGLLVMRELDDALGLSDPSSPSATAMRVTLKLPEGERKRQDKKVRAAEKRGRLTKIMHIRHPSRPLLAVWWRWTLHELPEYLTNR